MIKFGTQWELGQHNLRVFGNWLMMMHMNLNHYIQLLLCEMA